jgi:hypothetical protein
MSVGDIPKFMVGADVDAWASSVNRAITAAAGVGAPTTLARPRSVLAAHRMLRTVVRNGDPP